jgi:DNA-binding CsgD family transcriptional regulator
VQCSHGEYVRWRAREIAYGRWDPWADAAAVRCHVERLRSAGASYQAIASVAGVSPMTVYRLHGEMPRPGERDRPGRQPSERVSAATAQRLLAVTPTMVEHLAARRDATGARRRLQALIALGHPAASLAHRLGIAPRRVSSVVYGTTATVTPSVHAAVCELYDQLWDVPPFERTLAEREAAAAARALAASRGWPTPMGLDDDRIDDPAYRPRAQWRLATGSDARLRLHGRLFTEAPSRGKLSTADGRRALDRRSRCQAASARHRSGGH